MVSEVPRLEGKTMEVGRDYVFKIGSYSPETIPMERLAAYMSDLAKLVGNIESVHFLAIEPGSAALKYRVDEAVATGANLRIRAAHAGAGPRDALQAYHALNRKLVEDRSSGLIQEADGAEIIQFPGGRVEPEEELRGFGQRDSLDGVVQRVGRSRREASVLIETRDRQNLPARTYKSTAQRLARHIFGSEVRLHGYGIWMRTRDGVWMLSDFWINDFEVLEDTPLADVIAELHAIEGSEWPNLPDPWDELDRLRHGDPETAQ